MGDAFAVQPGSAARLLMEEESSLRQKVYIEFLRIAACFLVIVNHTNSQIFLGSSPSPTWFCSLTYFFICKIAVPVFLLITGALLLEKEDPPKKTAERVIRIFTVLFVGSFCYYAYYSWRNGTAFSIKEFLWNLPQTNATNSFWYLYLYLALMCLLPILQKLVKALTKRQLEYLLFLSLGILGTAPLIPSFDLASLFVAGLIGPYIGQVLLGYYIEHYVPLTKRVFRGCLCAFVLLIALQVAGTFYLYQRNPSSYLSFDNRTLNTITGSAACFYICVKYIFTKHTPRPALERGLCRLGALTFGIYLLADLVIDRSGFLYPMLGEYMPSLAAMVLWELVIFAVCALIAAALRRIPVLRKWI